MKTPQTSRLFTRWSHPTTGIESYVLTERVAPVQQSLYYTVPSMTDDGRYLWLRCAYPPEGGRHAQAVLGVVDFELDELRVYPETQHPTAAAGVDVLTGDVYWGVDRDIWKRGPRTGDKPVRISRLPDEIPSKGLERIATHLTHSADRKSLALDARAGLISYLGDIPLDGSPMRIWQRIEKYHNHAIFSPTDPDTILFAYEHWKEPSSGAFNGATKYHRMWLLRRGQKAEPVLKEPVSHSGHEWWDADGKHVWYVHYGVGIKKVDLATRQETNVWPGRLSHGYSDRSSRYLTADWMLDPRVCDCIVYFYDVQTKKQLEIVSRPPLAEHLTQITHLHPHPQFVSQDRYICYTTTVHDRVDVALTPVEPLKAMTK